MKTTTEAALRAAVARENSFADFHEAAAGRREMPRVAPARTEQARAQHTLAALAHRRAAVVIAEAATVIAEFEVAKVIELNVNATGGSK